MLENDVSLTGSREKSGDNDIPMFNYVFGEDALLSCDIVDADWAYVTLSTSIIPRDIASSGQVVPKLAAKYSIKMSADGVSPVGLIVNNASLNDAGIYCCSKDLKSFRYVHLVIEGTLEQLTYFKLDYMCNSYCLLIHLLMIAINCTFLLLN